MTAHFLTFRPTREQGGVGFDRGLNSSRAPEVNSQATTTARTAVPQQNRGEQEGEVGPGSDSPLFLRILLGRLPEHPAISSTQVSRFVPARTPRAHVTRAAGLFLARECRDDVETPPAAVMHERGKLRSSTADARRYLGPTDTRNVVISIYSITQPPIASPPVAEGGGRRCLCGDLRLDLVAGDAELVAVRAGQEVPLEPLVQGNDGGRLLAHDGREGGTIGGGRRIANDRLISGVPVTAKPRRGFYAPGLNPCCSQRSPSSCRTRSAWSNSWPRGVRL